jgi:NitT/TauT family transport system permease protein
MIGALISEYYATLPQGLGYNIKNNIGSGQFTTAWAYILTASALGILLFIVMMLIEKFALRNRKASG